MRHSYFSSGTLQKDRASTYLDPDYVSVDEKTTAEFLVFVKKYAQLIRFWNLQNNPEDNWEAFFQNDLCILLANINQIDIGQYPKQFEVIASE